MRLNGIASTSLHGILNSSFSLSLFVSLLLLVLLLYLCWDRLLSYNDYTCISDGLSGGYRYETLELAQRKAVQELRLTQEQELASVRAAAAQRVTVWIATAAAGGLERRTIE